MSVSYSKTRTSGSAAKYDTTGERMHAWDNSRDEAHGKIAISMSRAEPFPVAPLPSVDACPDGSARWIAIVHYTSTWAHRLQPPIGL
jgi:hypothetical protein